MVEGFHVEVGENIVFVALEGKSGPTGRNDSAVWLNSRKDSPQPMVLFTEGHVTTGNLALVLPALSGVRLAAQ